MHMHTRACDREMVEVHRRHGLMGVSIAASGESLIWIKPRGLVPRLGSEAVTKIYSKELS
jgi:hypothetical protein